MPFRFLQLLRPESNPARFDIVAGSTYPDIGRSRASLVIRTPSISPDDPDRDTYFVLDDFGCRPDCAWHETDAEALIARARR